MNSLLFLLILPLILPPEVEEEVEEKEEKTEKQRESACWRLRLKKSQPLLLPTAEAKPTSYSAQLALLSAAQASW